MNVNSLDYHISNILEIDTVISEDDDEYAMTHEEFMGAIQNCSISPAQYRRINQLFKDTQYRIEVLRRDALSVPTFTPRDFHALDILRSDLSRFASFFSWYTDEELVTIEASVWLKQRITEILDIAQTNPYPNNYLDKMWNSFRNKKYSFLRVYRKYKERNGAVKVKPQSPF